MLRGQLLRKILVAGICMALIAGMITVMDSEVYAANEVAIDISKEYQEIRGFGGINLPEWVGSDLSDSQRQTVFGNGENELGFQVLRIFVSDDRNQWSKAVPTAKAAIEKGAIVFASPWNPPSDMAETFTRANGGTGKRLKHDKYAAYAQHLNDFVKYMADNGVDLYAISVQNEPDYAEEWTWWTEEECLDFMKNYAGNINCKVISPESFQYRKNMYDGILNDEKALENMDILGTHFYGTSYNDFPYPLFQEKGKGKELWMTEVYYPNSDKDSNENWDQALSLSQHISNSLTDANMQAYVWWYIRRNYGPLNENGTISKRGYVMAQFSKYIRNGYKRVEATKNPLNDVIVSAYKGDGKLTVVAINMGGTNYNTSCNIGNATIAGVECIRTSGSENIKKIEGSQFSGNNLSMNLAAKSVTTYVLDLEGTNTDDVSDSSQSKENENVSADDLVANDTDSSNDNDENSSAEDSQNSDSDGIDLVPSTADNSYVEYAVVGLLILVVTAGIGLYKKKKSL